LFYFVLQQHHLNVAQSQHAFHPIYPIMVAYLPSMLMHLIVIIIMKVILIDSNGWWLPGRLPTFNCVVFNAGLCIHRFCRYTDDDDDDDKIDDDNDDDDNDDDNVAILLFNNIVKYINIINTNIILITIVIITTIVTSNNWDR
jgi:hypothetical protein